MIDRLAPTPEPLRDTIPSKQKSPALPSRRDFLVAVVGVGVLGAAASGAGCSGDHRDRPRPYSTAPAIPQGPEACEKPRFHISEPDVIQVGYGANPETKIDFVIWGDAHRDFLRNCDGCKIVVKCKATVNEPCGPNDGSIIVLSPRQGKDTFFFDASSGKADNSYSWHGDLPRGFNFMTCVWVELEGPHGEVFAQSPGTAIRRDKDTCAQGAEQPEPQE